MQSPRRNFLLALALYVGWVLGLGTLAWQSGSPPPAPPANPATAR